MLPFLPPCIPLPALQLLANVKVSMIYVIRLDKTLSSTRYPSPSPSSLLPPLTGRNIARGQSQAGGISARSHNNIIVGNIL